MARKKECSPKVQLTKRLMRAELAEEADVLMMTSTTATSVSMRSPGHDKQLGPNIAVV